MWTTSTIPAYEVGMRPDGWYEGAMKAKDEGLFDKFGLTTHAGGDTLRYLIDTGLFEMVTLPFHILDSSRLKNIDYAINRGMAVIAMNPLAGGLLGTSNNERIDALLEKAGVKSLPQLAIQFVNAFGASALAGMNGINEAKENCEAVIPPISREKAMQYRDEILQIVDTKNFACTSCGYCMPCPQGIEIPEVMKHFNYYQMLGMEGARERLVDWAHWNQGYQVGNCIECGICEGKCPNKVDIINEMRKVLALST
jgi:predicted aldo/keto reductase-like oxidoreductase